MFSPGVAGISKPRTQTTPNTSSAAASTTGYDGVDWQALQQPGSCDAVFGCLGAQSISSLDDSQGLCEAFWPSSCPLRDDGGESMLSLSRTSNFFGGSRKYSLEQLQWTMAMVSSSAQNQAIGARPTTESRPRCPAALAAAARAAVVLPRSTPAARRRKTRRHRCSNLRSLRQGILA